jgi:hypothetical protein
VSVTQLYADDLDHGIPPLLVGAAVVALVPATDLRGWAAETAWKVARAAAASGRRTALVDCFVDAPTLHGVGGAGNDEGIVDAFEYGASLNRIVQAQPQANLFFIPTGTFATDAAPMMLNPRWRRLSAGFRHEEALLLLYVSADHLGGLAAEPDGMVVLAPQGLDLAVADAPALTQAVGRGMPLLAVVANEDRRAAGGGSGQGGGRQEAGAAPGEPAAPESAVPMAGLLASQHRPNWPARLGILLGLAAAGAMIWYGVTPRRAGAPAVSRQPSAVSPRATSQQPPVAVPPVESLPFAVQVAALSDLVDAFVAADSLQAHGTPAIIAPVRLRGRGVRYRVHAGPFASAVRADSVLAALRNAGTITSTAGTRDSLPLSIALGAGLTRGAARAEQLRLRTVGVPAFILGAADGTFRLFAGAYSASAQAVLLQDLLTPTGSAGELVPRAGYVP